MIDYIAENVGDSVRDLEGIVISIMAHSTIYNKEIDLELTQRIVRKVVNSESKAVTVDEIINTVCKHFGLETATIHTKIQKAGSGASTTNSHVFSQKTIQSSLLQKLVR